MPGRKAIRPIRAERGADGRRATVVGRRAGFGGALCADIPGRGERSNPRHGPRIPIGGPGGPPRKAGISRTAAEAGVKPAARLEHGRSERISNAPARAGELRERHERIFGLARHRVRFRPRRLRGLRLRSAESGIGDIFVHPPAGRESGGGANRESIAPNLARRRKRKEKPAVPRQPPASASAPPGRGSGNGPLARCRSIRLRTPPPSSASGNLIGGGQAPTRPPPPIQAAA